MSNRISIDIAVTETSLDEVEQIHEDGKRPGTKIKNTDVADTMNGVVTTKQHTRRPLTSKHFYGGSFCSKNKQITTVLNVVYKSAPK